MTRFLLTMAVALILPISANAANTSDTHSNNSRQTQKNSQQDDSGGQKTKAASNTSRSDSSKFITAQKSGHILATQKLIGASIYNRKGKEIGSVGDLIVNKQGHIVAVVISHGGTIGIGAKSVALPWGAIHFVPKSEITKKSKTGSKSGSGGNGSSSSKSKQGPSKPEMVLVAGVTNKQMDNAPSFKTLEQQQQNKKAQEQKSKQLNKSKSGSSQNSAENEKSSDNSKAQSNNSSSSNNESKKQKSESGQQ